MLTNHIKVAFRNILSNKAFSSINILGLALGLACSLLISLWVNDERSIDKFNTNSKQIYSVYERLYSAGEVQAGHYTPGILAEEIKRTLPAVQYTCSSFEPMLRSFKTNNKALKQTGTFASADFFKIFSYELILGNKESCLTTPDAITISENMAIAFFGNAQKAIGQTIRLENRKDFRVSGIFKNLPKNASTKFDYVINWQAAIDDNDKIKDWGNSGFSTYIQLKKGINVDSFEKQIINLLHKYTPRSDNYHVELGIQRFEDMYLHSRFNEKGQIEGGRIEYVQLFSIVALVILIIACINFANLATARSVKRAKEIGVRKVIGARQSSLIGQFLSEAFLVVLISMIIALTLVALLLPAFNILTQKQVLFPFLYPIFWLSVFGLTLAMALLAGFYPALVLSSLKPVKVLKGMSKISGGHATFRKGLVVFQFVLSIVLISGTIIVSKQVDYIQTKNLGFERDNLLYIPKEGNLKSKFNLFKEQALKIPGVEAISYTRHEPTNITSGTSNLDWEGKNPNVEPIFSHAGIGEDFAKTMNIEVLDGRDFSKEFPTDTSGYILNETAVKLIGYKNPVGRTFTYDGRKAPIVGLVQDFHFTSLHDRIQPMVFWFGEKKKFNGNVLVRLQAGRTQQALAGLEKLIKEFNPDFPFTYKFADESYHNLYKSEWIVGSLSKVFAVLAIFISCLGLLGLAMFTTGQRTKEIGIRKVLGASAAAIVQLLSKDFLALVFIAILIASPIAWLTMNNWLQGFAYRVDIQWWMLALAGGMAIIIALVTVSFQAVKAALANPVKSLRAE
jgi:predicted permease